jgi:hypothetical protein
MGMRWRFRSPLIRSMCGTSDLFFPDPAKAVAEMTRVVRPGGMVAAYAWDILGGGFTLEPLRIELRAMGIKPVDPPSVEASRIEAMRDL